MHKLINLDDTIIAISTALGQGSIGIIRISGKEAISIADKMFVAQNKKKPSDLRNFSVNYGWIVNKRQENKVETIDEVLLTIMRGPRSYTREDIVEISCHGGIVSLRSILQLAIDLGGRLAEPGEFTKRAYLNGRIDLVQAEAVLDIIQAKTNAFLKVSTNQLKGELSVELESIREVLMDIYTEMEAIVNFPEDEVEKTSYDGFLKNIFLVQERIETLLDSSEHGKILKEGIKIVLCGKTNVGKSSLLNVLLKQPRAIVSNIEGTTRDTIEETAQIKGIPFQLIDTAGMLEPRDHIEEEAIKRSHIYRENADLILLIFDSSGALTQEDKSLIEKLSGQNMLLILNKSDLTQKIAEEEIKRLLPDKKIIKISALKKIAINDLENAIVENVWHGKVVDTQGLLLSNVRHINSLKKCKDALLKSQETLKKGLSLEFVSEVIKEAIVYLDNITGRDVDNDLIENIFSQFCIGK